MSRAAVFTIIFLVVWGVFTAVFAASAPKDQVRLMPKWVWAIVCVILPFFGGLLYLMVGRPLAGTAGNGGRFGGGSRSGKRARQTKVVAPDDDPRFLRDLEKRLREQAEREKQQEAGDKPDTGSEPGADPGSEPGADPGSEPDSSPEKPKDS